MQAIRKSRLMRVRHTRRFQQKILRKVCDFCSQMALQKKKCAQRLGQELVQFNHKKTLRDNRLDEVATH